MIVIKPIKSEADYRNALKAIDELWDASPNTSEGDNLEILITLVEKYEMELFPIDDPDPIEAIKFTIENRKIERKVLEKIFGSKSRVTEIMKKQRKLNLKMIRNLHNTLHIPYEILAAEYSIEKR